MSARRSPTDYCLLTTDYCSNRYGLADDFEEAAQPGGHVRSDLDADGAASARRERAEVAERLRLLERREGVGLAGYLHVARVRGRDLDEDAAVGAALVELARRVQEARAVARRRRAARRVAQVRAYLLDDPFGVIRLLEVVEQRDVVARARALQMVFEHVRHCACFNRLARGVVGVDGEPPVRGEYRLF